MQPHFHQEFLSAASEAGLARQRDAMYQKIQIKSTGIPSEAPDPQHGREAFANKASNKINLNHKNIILLYAIITMKKCVPLYFTQLVLYLTDIRRQMSRGKISKGS